MKTRHTQRSFIAEAKTKHGNKYNYSKTKYINLAKKIIIICPIHGEFNQAPSSHLKGSGCAKCGLEKSKKNKVRNCAQAFLKKAPLVHNNKYDYSKVNYKKTSHKVEIICTKHGSFFQSPNQHLNGRGCKQCGIEQRSKKRQKAFKSFVKEANKTHKNYYKYSPKNYKGTNKKVEIICPKHGVFHQKGNDHLGGKGCYSCGRSAIIKKNTKDKSTFISQAKKVHSDKYNYSKVKYSTGRVKIEIICSKHGSFLQTPEGHLSGRGCPNCCYFISKKETNWLNEIGLPNTAEYRNVTLKVNGKVVRVDGFDPQTQTVYEFHGDYWHGNPKIYSPNKTNEKIGKTFGELYEETIKRENLLKAGGFLVISVWESDYNISAARVASGLLSP